MESSIVLGGGCFWCMEAVFKRIDGILSVTPGYAGGSLPNPSYEQVCTDKTGHAEVVRIAFDPARISLDDVLDIYWKAHDPTTLNRQGEDVGTQYRSVIFFTSEEQRGIAASSLAKAQRSFKDKIVTELKPLQAFYPAEDYHKDYFDQHRTAGYCRLVIAPKLHKLGLE